MTVTTKTITGTITSTASNLYTAPANTVSKVIDLSVSNSQLNTATLNLDSLDPSVPNFETYTAQGASYSGNNYSVTTLESNPNGLTFNDTGSKMYVVGVTNDTIYEYDLSTAWDITTATYNSVNLYIGGDGVNNPCDITFGNNGSKLYIGWENFFGFGREMDLSTPYDITTATTNTLITYNSPWWSSISSEFYTVSGFSFNDDGTKIYVNGYNSKLNQFSLATPWNISSIIVGSRITLQLSGNVLSSAIPASDGKRFYYTDNTFPNAKIHEIELSTAWDLSTATNSVRSFSVYNETPNPRGIAIRSDDSELFIIEPSTDTVIKYNLSFFGDLYVNPWTLSDVSFAHKSPSLLSQETDPYGLDFKNDGTKMYIVGFFQEQILQYSLSTPFDVSTATYDSISNIGLNTPIDLQFKPDGTSVLVLNDRRYVNQYNLSTAWDISTISTSVNQLDTFNNGFTADNQQRSFYVKPDGTRLYVTTTNSSDSYKIQQYNLSTAWDLSTATVDVSLTSPTTLTYGIGFTDDGNVMFTMESPNILRKWNLSTPWEVNTAVSDSTFDLDTLDIASGGVNETFNFKLIQNSSQIAVVDERDRDVLTFNIYEDAGVGNAPAGKLSLQKSTSVSSGQNLKINKGSLVLNANNTINASTTENTSYSITVQELTDDIAGGFKVVNKPLTLGNLKQTVLTAASNTRIYGCQVSNFDGVNEASFTTYLNDTPILTKTVQPGDSVLGITPGLSLSAGDVISIQPGNVGDVQVSLTYEEY